MRVLIVFLTPQSSYCLFYAPPHEVTQLDPNIVVQLFSPLVTSQRIMATQFNNPYTSISCQDGTNVVFKEVCLLVNGNFQPRFFNGFSSMQILTTGRHIYVIPLV